ncbi:cellulose binding domain-containing protein [Streptomyces cynarae]
MTVKNLGRNARVAGGSSVSFGFTGSWSGSNTEPTAFELNAQTCTVS